MDQVLKTIRNYEMVKPGDRILAAVSGGPDSVFLLHSLVRMRKKLGIARIAVCNLDHGLRGKESQADSLFVKRLAAELGLEAVCKKITLKKSARKLISTEEAAREARYKFFREAARRAGANVIATGHTLDDQAETILMRFMKGASLKGIVGIAPVREESGMRIIRPLMELEKKQIECCLDTAGISYRIDSTNLEPIYFRNIVRKDIMPFLEKYNPRLKRALFNLAEHLREDFEFIAAEKANAAKKIMRGKGGSVEISLKDIVLQPRAIQKEILRDSLERSGGLVKKLSFRHWKEVENLIRRKGRGSSLDLPGGVRVSRTSRSINFLRL